jgi:hypothetical protein
LDFRVEIVVNDVFGFDFRERFFHGFEHYFQDGDDFRFKFGIVGWVSEDVETVVPEVN